MTQDSDYERWLRKYKKFQSVQSCVELLKRRNVQGELVDIICGVLEESARGHEAELINAANSPDNRDIRRILLGVIEDARIPQAMTLFADILATGDQQERPYALRGLEKLGTKTARRLLWESSRDPK